MNTIFNILVFVLILSLIIIVHEVGHLLTAKKFGVYCTEFAIGMGPVVYQKQKGETMYSLRAIPLGGYVQMAGEEGVDVSEIPHERTLNGIRPLHRILVLAAGAIMNILLAWIIFIGVVMVRGNVQVEPLPVVGVVVEDTPADHVGLMSDDVIVQITKEDGSVIEPKTFNEMGSVLDGYRSGSLLYTIKRGEETLHFKITPEYNEESKRYMIGIQSKPNVKEISWYESFYYGTKEMVTMTVEIVKAFGQLITGTGLKDVSGPVGIYQATSQMTSLGFMAIILWVALLSLNIGVFNLIPIPILDGGRIVLILVELLIGKKLSEKVETGILFVGLAFIVGLMLFATWNDIVRLF